MPLVGARLGDEAREGGGRGGGSGVWEARARITLSPATSPPSPPFPQVLDPGPVLGGRARVCGAKGRGERGREAFAAAHTLESWVTAIRRVFGDASLPRLDSPIL